MIAGVGLGLRTVRGTSFCLIQLGPKTGGSLGEMGGPNRCRSLCSARAPDHLCTPIMSRPKWNGSLSYAVPRVPTSAFIRPQPVQHNLKVVPLILCCHGFSGAGFLGSPFPPCSRPGRPTCGSGNSPVPWSKKGLVGCGIYPTRSGTDVDDIITTYLCVPLGMLNATSPTGITCAFVSLSVVSTGCLRAARLTPICISSSKVPYPYARILG
jgi:hypothetical protein